VILKPADTMVCFLPTCSAATGAATNADVLPTATAYRNGTSDAGFVLTVANVATGLYKVTGTVPAYSVGDKVSIIGSATVGGIAGVAPIFDFVVDTSRASDVETDTVDIQNRLPAALVGGRIDASIGADALGLSTLDAQDVADALKLEPAVGAPASGSVNADLDSLLGTLGTAGDGLTSLGDTRLDGIADIQGRLPAALVSGRMDSYIGAIAGSVVTSIQSGLSTLTASQVWGYTSRTLTSFGSLVASVVAGVWAAATSGMTVVGSIGKLIADKLPMIGVASVSWTSPVSDDGGNMNIVRGDTYSNDEGRRLDFTDDGGTWPDMEMDDAVILRIIAPDGSETSFDGAVIELTPKKKVGIELTASQSATLVQGTSHFQVRLVKDMVAPEEDHRLTLAEGSCTCDY
jgi:hypothetical protein